MARLSRKKKLAIALASSIFVTHHLYRPTAKTREWCKSFIKQHDDQGAYNNLLKELELGDEVNYRKFLRMDVRQFNELGMLIGNSIRKQTTHFRAAICCKERLAITLRFLATGMITYVQLFKVLCLPLPFFEEGGYSVMIN